MPVKQEPDATFTVRGKSFSAAGSMKDGVVISADGEIRYMVGWIKASVKEYCNRNGWLLKITDR